MRDRETPENLFKLQTIGRRSLLKKAAAVSLSAGLGAVLSPGASLAETPRRGGAFIAAVKGGSTTDTLDPTIMLSPAPLYISYQFGSRLLERTPKGTLTGELAESWDALDGGKRWVFKLKKGVQFHNGKEFTASDMIYSLNRHRGPDSKSGAASLMKNIEDIRADGAHEITVLLKSPDAGLGNLMSNAQLIATPENEKPDKGIGTGPFIVEEAEPGVRYAFRRNPHYFKPDRAWFDRVEILVVNDDTARTSALLSGAAHLVTDVTPVLVDRLKESPTVTIDATNSTLFYYFVMQCDKPPFDNPDLRLAMKYAVDREVILRRTLAGYGAVGNDSPLNSIYPLYSDDIPMHSYDPEKARYHYKRSGHSGSIVLHTSDGAFPGAVDAAQIFQQNAAKAGITIEIKREPADGYWDDIWMKVPFCASYFGSLSTEDQALSQPYASDSPWNDSSWFRPDFDKLLVEARSELEVKRRKALYREATMMVHDDGGHIVLMFTDSITGISRDVKGFIGDPFHADGRQTERCWFEA